MAQINISNFANQDWTWTPVAQAFNSPPIRSAHDQRWILNLTGIAIPNYESKANESQWDRVTLYFWPDTTTPLTRALTSVNIEVPAGQYPVMMPDQWSPFATINSIFDQNTAVNAGFAVDSWRPVLSSLPGPTGDNVSGVFIGLEVDIAVSDKDAWLYRVGYSITLIGRIVLAVNS